MALTNQVALVTGARNITGQSFNVDGGLIPN